MIKQVIATPNCTHTCCIFIVYIHVGAVQRKVDSLITRGGTYDRKENFEDLVFETAKRKGIVPAECVRYINLHVCVYIKLLTLFFLLKKYNNKGIVVTNDSRRRMM